MYCTSFFLVFFSFFLWRLSYELPGTRLILSSRTDSHFQKSPSESVTKVEIISSLTVVRRCFYLTAITLVLLLRLYERYISNVCRQRPYHVESTGSRPITEIKQRRARLVLGWVTAWEHRVLLAYFFFLFFFSPPPPSPHESPLVSIALDPNVMMILLLLLLLSRAFNVVWTPLAKALWDWCNHYMNGSLRSICGRHDQSVRLNFLRTLMIDVKFSE